MSRRNIADCRCSVWVVCLLFLLTAPSGPSAQTPSETTYVRITRPSVRVRSDISERSATLGVAEKGQRFPLLDYTDEAFKILYVTGTRTVEGWIDRNKAEIVRPTTPPLKMAIRPYARQIAAAALALVAVAVVGIVIAIVIRRSRAKAATRIASHKTLLLVALKPKQIRDSLRSTTTTIERCFSGIGYSVHVVRSVEQFEQRLRHRAPDAVLVDWEAGPGIADEIEISLAANERTLSVPIIYYNVPPEIPATRRPRLRHVYYAGTEISDRDLFKLIQPHTLGLPQTTIVRKGGDASAIEGEVSEGGLSAVLQLIEIGQKTGCLLVQQNQPVGVICFENGNPTYAATASNRGEKAIYELLDLTSGKFSFASGRKAAERNCTVSTMGVLMEWARVRDERSRA